MTTLTLLLPSDWPQQRRECAWLLHDPQGQLLERGYSAAAHWPGLRPADAQAARAPQACVLLLAGEQTASQRVALPATARGRSPELMATALEDRLLEPTEQLHFACRAQPGADGLYTIAVLGRARLEALVQTLQGLGLQPRSAWPLGLALPAGSALLCGGELTLASADGSYAGCRADAQLPPWLALHTDGTPLACGVLDHELEPATQALLRELEEAGQLQRQADLLERLQLPPGPGWLYGPLAPPRARQALAPHLRPALAWALGLACAVVLLALLQWAWYGWQAAQLRAELNERFRQAFPQAVIVDPLLQMRRQVEAARRAGGYLADDDFLALMRPLAQLPAGRLRAQQISYQGGQLRVLAQLGREDLALLRNACQQLGVALALLPQAEAGADQPIEFTLSPGGRP